MTIFVAIKVGSTIYMAADSMVTGEVPQDSVSVSGDQLEPTPTGPIADRCWKINPIGAQQLLTYSGAEKTGEAIAEVLHNNFIEEDDPIVMIANDSKRT